MSAPNNQGGGSKEELEADREEWTKWKHIVYMYKHLKE